MSFSFDFAQLLQIASQIFNALMPIVIIGGGITLGIALVHLVMREIKGIG